MAESVINADREMLVMKYRYMVRALYALKAKRLEICSTVKYGTDGVSFFYDVDKLLADYLGDEVDTSSIYLHSVVHCLYMHPFFADKYKYRDVWDLSCDIFAYYIMAALEKEVISSELESKINDFKDKVMVITAQSLYRYLSSQLEKGIIGAEYLADMGLMFRVDDHDLWYSENGESENIESGNGKSEGGESKNGESGNRKSEDGESGNGKSEGGESKNGESGDGKSEDEESENGEYGNGKSKNGDSNGGKNKHMAAAYAMWSEIVDQTEVGFRSQHSGHSQNQGTEKGDILEFLTGIKRDYVDYSDFLRKFAVIEERMLIDMDSFDYNFYTYGLELYEDMPLIEPLEYKEEYTIREFVIAIDTSGSCDIELIRKFLTVTYDILFESIIDETSMEVHIIQCDADVQEDYIVRKKEDMNKYAQNLVIRGRGGTDFRPVFEQVDRIRENGGLKGLRGLIYFTDGYGIFPSKPTDYKTAFAFAEMDKNVIVPPWIMKTYIEKELL